MKRTLTIVTTFALSTALLTGCATTGQSAGADAGSTPTALAADASIFEGDLSPDTVLAANADYTTVNEDEWSAEDAVSIALEGSGATAGGDGVSVDGSTITITAAGVYSLSGSLDGQVVVAAPEDALVVLILDGAQISNTEGPAIEVQAADDVAIHLAAGSENSVSDADSYAEDDTANSAIDAKSDLTISGEGALTVRGNGNDGVSSTDDLVILSGTIDVTAADDALRGKDSLVVEGGALSLTATAGDGLKSDQEDDETQGYILVRGGTIDVEAGDDGLQAQTDTVVTGGAITAAVADDGVKGEAIVSVGEAQITVTESTEAMEAANVAIFAGTLDLTASDDGINASGINTGGQDRETDTGERLEISGGSVTVNAGADGLDSNGTITVSGGTVTITSANQGGESPIDANGEVSVAEGSVTANGAAYDPATAQSGGPGGGAGGPGGEMPQGGGTGSEPPQ